MPASAYGCSKCIEKAQIVDRHKQYLQHDSDAPLRTKDSTVLFSQIAQANPNVGSVCGVKGLSPLVMCDEFDYVRDNVIDSMHHLYLHVVKEMLELWFSEELQDENAYPWTLHAHIDQIDMEFHKIQIPHGREEPPRSLKDRHKWKGKYTYIYIHHIDFPSYTHPHTSGRVSFFFLVYFSSTLGTLSATKISEALATSG